ncbi:MAG: NAD(P)H-binding protein [Anaerolineae bacterium]|nr:NAD(P)H-binding protein [Anaerolineae bacterium]
MSESTSRKPVFVAGANGFLGASVVYALLEAGAQVTALIPPGEEPRFTTADGRVRVVTGDAWSLASLKGRSRGHAAVLHLIGSLRQEPSRGLTYAHLNVASLRNIARMAIGDGVPHLIFLSAASAPWLSRAYLASKREAEDYLRRSGVTWTVVRAPLFYPRGRLRNPTLWLLAGLGRVPLLGWPVARYAPLPVDVAARGLARLALDGDTRGQTVYGALLRRRGFMQRRQAQRQPGGDDPFLPRPADPPPPLEEEPPFGWLP